MSPEDLPARLQEVLLPVSAQPQSSHSHQPAAVLAPLYYYEKEWFLLYTRRPDTISSHAGQVSFPGGRIEPGDTGLQFTALRETEEEIGIERSAVLVLGQLTTFPTGTGYLITPFVGIIPWPSTLSINPREVAEVFSVPLHWLRAPQNFTRKDRPRQPDLNLLPSIRYESFQGHTIWGATAWITYELLSKIDGIE